MTYGKQQSGYVLELSEKENAEMLQEKPIVKTSGDARGEFTITVKLERKKS